MNKENLLKVADLIEKSPNEKIQMGSWFGKYMNLDKDTHTYDYWSGTAVTTLEQIVEDERSIFDVKIDDKTGSFEILGMHCGTTACIAGWAFYSYLIDNDIKTYVAGLNVLDTAIDYLNLGVEEYGNLFYCEDPSIWYALKDEYGWDFDTGYSDTWSFPKKDVVHLLRRIANKEIDLSNAYVDTIISENEQIEYDNDYYFQ